MKYNIVFIDEQQDLLDDFSYFIENSQHKDIINPICILPEGDIDDMIDVIFGINPDAIITDFMLNDSRESINYNVSYTGSDLIRGFQNIREGFPCFVMTALDDRAINESDDVNMVYIKHIIYGGEKESKAEATFLDRVIKQIDHYYMRIRTAETELFTLLELRNNGTADIKQEERILELDSFLERIIDRRQAIPIEYKTTSNHLQLEQLIESVDKLIEKIHGEND